VDARLQAAEGVSLVLLRLATWNCCRASIADTASAVAALDASIAVVQEIRRPAKVPRGQIWRGISPRNGVAAVPAGGWSVRLGRRGRDAPWSILPLHVSGPLEFNLLMVWTRAEHRYIEGLNAAVTRYERFLRAAPSVVIGDFNANVIWDNPRRPADFSRLAQRLTGNFGLVSAYHVHSGEAYGAESKATHFFWRRRSRPYHIDYCFVPRSWTRRIRSVAVLDVPPWVTMSDHCPLVVDLEMRSAR
jgi:hypothetical protein